MTRKISFSVDDTTIWGGYGYSVIIFCVCVCLVTAFFLLVLLLLKHVLLLNQRWPPPLRLQASDSNTFRIMCDIPTIYVFVVNKLKFFPVGLPHFS
jgi:hypothetical protein